MKQTTQKKIEIEKAQITFPKDKSGTTTKGEDKEKEILEKNTRR